MPKAEFTFPGFLFAKTVMIMVASKNAPTSPTTGEMIMPVTTFSSPPKIIACVPAPAIPAPIIPPTSA